ncbi:bile acid-CoA:amino acid N-acyltransferase-like isoform X2 [Ptychodera flava]|uniref:bile acid-CoA:amino acid N-acyltransferase-like isoform X2 n=1 Tax=Ptychodera flava TaxID=63121 RepID=UPI00396A767C
MARPFITVTPCRAMMDEQVSITVSHLTPNQPITLLGTITDEKDITWTSYAHYRADERGFIHVMTQESLGGTYQGVEPMGLFWSLQANRDNARLRWRDIDKPLVFHIKGYPEFLQGPPKDLDPFAMATTERWYLGTSTNWENVKTGRIKGKLFTPNGPGPYPAIIDLYGGGGTFDYRAALLASHGYVTLSLLHVLFEDIGYEGADLDYFEVNRDYIAMYGISAGAVRALEVATETTRQIKCVVSINASYLKYINIITRSVPLNPDLFGEAKEKTWNSTLADLFTITDEDIQEGRVLAVHNLECPVLIVAGSDDQLYHADEHATKIKNHMKRAGKGHLCRVLRFPKAGHLLEPPFTPHHYSSPISVPKDKAQGLEDIPQDKTLYPMLIWGGEVVHHAKAQERAWKAILHFLETNLRQTIPTEGTGDVSERAKL